MYSAQPWFPRSSRRKQAPSSYQYVEQACKSKDEIFRAAAESLRVKKGGRLPVVFETKLGFL